MPKARASYVTPGSDPRPPGPPGWTVGPNTVFFYRYYPWSGPSCVRLIASCPRWVVRGDDVISLLIDLTNGAQMKREVNHASQSTTHLFTDPEFESSFPHLYEHLACRCWDDDPTQPRITSTVTFFGDAGCLKACLRDRANSRTAWVAGSSLGECLEALEEQLRTATVQWRTERTEQQPAAKRIPKDKSS